MCETSAGAKLYLLLTSESRNILLRRHACLASLSRPMRWCMLPSLRFATTFEAAALQIDVFGSVQVHGEAVGE